MAKGSNNSTGRRSSSRNTKPYDANNSFVKKVATKVTDFIPQRSWISKWFNSSQNEGDVMDEIDNPEEIESEEDIQKPPPLKRPCIRMDVTHPPGTFEIQSRAKAMINKAGPPKQQYSMNDETSEDFSKPVMAGPSGMSHLISSTPATQSDVRNIVSQRSELNSLVATANNGTANGMDDNSESSESTSGCSSLIPQTNRQEAPSNVSYNSPFSNRKRFHHEKLNFTNNMQSPRSLFLDNTTRDSLSSRRPSFSASVMTNTSDRASPLTSPFYSGNITFGGANAAGLYKRGRKLFSSVNEIQLKVPKRTSVEVKQPNAAGVDSSGMSQTAKKILEALEHFSSPITDAKKIPLKMMNNASSLNRKRSREETAPSSTKVGLRHLTRELTVPTVPDILKLKRRQKLQDTTAAARKIVSARSEPPPPQEYHIRTHAYEEHSKHHGKVKAKTADLEQEETVEQVNLPNIPLPISSLPNFNFMPHVGSKVPDKPNIDKEDTFTFASPIRVPSAAKNLKSINNFTFSSPINADKESSDKLKVSGSPLKATGVKSNAASSVETDCDYPSPVAQNFMWSSSSTAPRPKEKAKNNINVVPSTSNELKSGSVMDILGSKSKKDKTEKSDDTRKNTANHKIDTITSSIGKDDNVAEFARAKCSKQQNTITSWECSECLFKNNNSETQCFACKTAKRTLIKDKDTSELPSSSDTSETKSTVNDTFGSKFKLSTNQWECTSCFVRNRQTDTKCVACGTLTPNMKQEATANAIKSPKSDTIGVKPLEKSWECSKCKLKNSENSSSCLSCDTCKTSLLKANSQKDTDNKTSTSASTGKEKTMDKFKPSKDTWECPCCMVRSAASTDTCPCCNTAKPSAGVATKSAPPLFANGFGEKFKKPEGSWNCDSCMLQNEAKVTECVACGGAKPGSKKPATTSNLQFNFGMPTNTGDFKFGIDKAGQEKSGNTVSANGFKFGNSQQNNEVGQFTFGIQKEEKKSSGETVKSEKDAPTPSGSGFAFQSSTSNNEKTEVKQDSSTAGKKVTPTFSFGIPKAVSATAKSNEQPTNTAVSSTFTFGVPKSNAQPNASEEKQSSLIGNNGLTAVPKPSTVITEPAVAAPTSTLSLAIQSSSEEAKPTATFSFGIASSTAATPSSASATVVSSLPSSTQSSFTFVEPKSTAQKTLAPPSFGQIPTTAPTSIAANNSFTFEDNKTTDAPLAKTFTSLPNASGSSLFSSISNSPSLFPNNETKSAPTFGQTSTEENKLTPAFGASATKTSTFAMPENKVATFGNTENKPSMFGTSDSKISVFGSTDAKIPSLFNPTPQASAAPAVPTPFGAPSSTLTLFGTSVTPIFGNNTAPTFTSESTPSIFGSTGAKQNEISAPNSNLFTFGTTPAQAVAPQTTGFNFSTNANPPTESTQKSLFTFGSNTTAPQSGGLFGNTFNNPATATNSPGFTFNAPKPETPAFGQPTAPSPIFGAAQTATQSQQAPSSSFSNAPANPGFNFGATPAAAPSGGYNFGAAATSAPSTGYNFNPPGVTPTFDPNTPPSFNFTGGNAPPAFKATPSATQRKFKKAFRRIR